MRTVTNVYLLNLAVSDLLLGVFCMPFTLVGQVLRNFIFGAIMCKLIPYFQAVCVSVGVWTLVAISLERYFAICRPLKSRRWQTQFHAFKVIVFVWISSLIWTSPIVVFSKLKAIKMGRHKCREEWPNLTTERAFNLFIDVILLLVPLIIMILAYALIVHKLWKGLINEIKHSSARKQGRNSSVKTTINGILIEKEETGAHFEECEGSPERITLCKVPSKRLTKKENNDMFKGNLRNRPRVRLWLKCVRRRNTWVNHHPRNNHLPTSMLLSEGTPCSSYDSSNEDCKEEKEKKESFTFENTSSYTFCRQAIRSNYMDKSIEAKKKVIRMLFVLVIEFFVCWAPLHVLNTWYLFSPEVIYEYVGSTGVSLVQLLAYISSCCNPITYCFMNKKFRQAFLNVFNRYRLCSLLKNKKENIFELENVKGGNNSIFYEGKIDHGGNRFDVTEVVVSEGRL